ncbi:MAG: transglutaminase domain-containing protein [Bacteroidales bacterium]
MIIRVIFFTVLLIMAGCTGRPVLIPESYTKRLEKDFREREIIPSSLRDELGFLFKKTDDKRVIESLKFLYAYMPLSDLADYPVEFFSENIKMALRAKDEMQWGASVPKEIFLHYVLPVRVNNENLDAFRLKMYDEIKDRVNGLDVEGAVIEINRWCHEKVTYQPSDIRTSSPLATMLSSRGRCGEESTFTVAALRTAGIPARQVYTPRWAHSDDNHAWVEVWIEGEWYYLGACEPEPILDRGWFTEPARRAMLVHTKAFGAYMGNENVIVNEKRYAEINNLSKYADTKVITVFVTDEGRPAIDAEVEFCLYNYAEFYPLAKVKTNKYGFSNFETGLGDLLIWAGTRGMYGYKFVSVGDADTVNIVLESGSPEKHSIDIDLSPPASPKPLPGINKELIELNKKLIARGDSIRNAYISSWITKDEAVKYANEKGYYDPLVPDLIIASHGNYREIMAFLEDNIHDKALAVELLKQISLKDLRDVRADVLSDHLSGASEFQESFREDEMSLFYKFVFNPRVANEMLTAWRRPLKDRFIGLQAEEMLSDSGFLLVLNHKIADLFRINDAENHYTTPVTPMGAMNVNTLDAWSRKIFTVAAYRSIGVPSRLEPGTNRPQYYYKGIWNSVWFPDEEMITDERSVVLLKHDGSVPEPEYFIHFTLARFSDGRYKTLSYDYNKKVSAFEEGLSLFPGDYLLVTGNRIDDKLIHASLDFFTVGTGEYIEIEVTPRR